METIPRIKSLGHVTKNSPKVPPWPPKQLRDEAAQLSRRKETANQTSSQRDDPDEIYYEECFKEDEVKVKVCQSINKIKLD